MLRFPCGHGQDFFVASRCGCEERRSPRYDAVLPEGRVRFRGGLCLAGQGPAPGSQVTLFVECLAGCVVDLGGEDVCVRQLWTFGQAGLK